MRIICSNCDYEIETKSQILLKYMCPNCFRVLKISIIRIILFIITLIIPVLWLKSINESDIFIISWSVMWVWFSISVIRPKVCKYTIVKHSGILDKSLYSLGSIKNLKNVST